ncbi:twin-arginine translocation signal domain-containing protein [Neptunomonas antarctica]|uniref:Tat (Twin-arginine translocation) pathway signal sequence n=1 Tax=Neptunomonas antarctica TaxID=619304 RepID=A0A1N7K085_9GAMM|nr:twin-arginine translocation signal domain-containing protein [Neptunomonas antarctica]SIS55005.1 Tat (twin-arginine translocation) pathway signal sequence [Neptunomonas antarctica]
MTNQNLSRRGFLKASGLTAASAVALTLSGLSISTNSWAMSLTKIDTHTGKSLSRLCRVLYPHTSLDEMYYDACVEALDEQTKTDNDLLTLLTLGVKALDSTSNSAFIDLPSESQLAAIKQIEETPFFNKVRGHVVVALYNNEKIWSTFGYQGPSYPFGGYLERGFNDINWLPNH